MFRVLVFLTLTLFLGAAEAQLRHGDRAVTVVNTPEVNVRSEPRVGTGTLMAKIRRGTQMKLLSKRGVWYQVLLPDGREAFVHANYAEEGIARDLLEVRASSGRVRERPTAARGSDVIQAVKRGDMLSLVREQNGWYLSILPSGKRGWIRGDLVIRRPVGPPAEAPAPPPEEPPPPPRPAAQPPKASPPSLDPYRRGLAHVKQRQVEEAMAAFREALVANPKDGSAHFELAKLLKAGGDREGAIEHFRNALKGDRPSPTAKFHLEELLAQASESAGAPGEQDVAPEPGGEEGGAALSDRLIDSAAYILPALAAASLLFLAAMGLIYRRRRALRREQPAYRRRRPDAGFDAVLKYAVEKRPLLRAIEEAEQRRTELDEALGQRFDAFSDEVPASGRLPSVESAESLIKKVEDLRQTIMDQEERAQIYADLVVLQNEKLDALDEEVAALKKLIQIEYRDARKRGQKRGGESPPSG